MIKFLPRRHRRGYALLTVLILLAISTVAMVLSMRATANTTQARYAQMVAREIIDIARSLDTYLLANVVRNSSTTITTSHSGGIDAYEDFTFRTTTGGITSEKLWRSAIDPSYTYDANDLELTMRGGVKIKPVLIADRRLKTPVGVLRIGFDGTKDDVFVQRVTQYVTTYATNPRAQGLSAGELYEEHLGQGTITSDPNLFDEFGIYPHSFASVNGDYLIRVPYIVDNLNQLETINMNTQNLINCTKPTGAAACSSAWFFSANEVEITDQATIGTMSVATLVNNASFDIEATGEIATALFTTTGDITLTGDVSITNDFTVTGAVSAGALSLSNPDPDAVALSANSLGEVGSPITTFGNNNKLGHLFVANTDTGALVTVVIDKLTTTNIASRNVKAGTNIIVQPPPLSTITGLLTVTGGCSGC